MKKLYPILSLLLTWSVVLFFSIKAFSTNPPVTNNMINLSEGVTEYGFEDRALEMVIDGYTIHTIWIQRTPTWDANGSYLFYRRSTDLGDTWENPIQLYQFIDESNSVDNTLRRLAVDNGVVHICTPDYDHANNGLGTLYYFRSSNGGASFESAVEIADTGGGYNAFGRSYIKASGGKVAIAIAGEGSLDGVWLFYSSNGGNSFSETLIFNESNNVSDLWFDGGQIIVLHDYIYYNYGLSIGKVWVSISNDNGSTFTTTKISVLNDGGSERCYVPHDEHYVPKIAKSGNNIHIIFMKVLDNNDLRTPVYVRSSNIGASFVTAVDINNETVSTNHIQSGHETIVARGNYVYMVFLQNNGKPFMVKSNNNGSSLNTPVDILTPETYYLTNTWSPMLFFDPADTDGQTIYFGGNSTLCRKSIDGGETFFNGFFAAPILEPQADFKECQMQIDNNGDFHFLIGSRWHYNYDFDVFYSHKKPQPDPGADNKALSIETVYSSDLHELVIVPSSESLQFENQITAEAWIKIMPGCDNKVNILAKVNGYDGDQYQPSGFNLAFHESSGKRYLNSGIETEQGQFVNWSGGEVADDLWHHVAFTYDADDVPNNFKTYLDGLLVAEQTVTGEVVKGDGLLMIGSRTYYSWDTYYKIDDIRIWDKALTQQEILENLNKKLTGGEDGLKLFLNFDDTFKDISGNGNDAIPLYLGELTESIFDPPLTQFNSYQTLNEVVFTNASENATSSFWKFGDETTSEEGFPTHIYSTPGEYLVSLTSENENSATSAIGHITVQGLNRVEPTVAGNSGYTVINVFGGGLTLENTSIILKKDGEDDIVGVQLNAPEEGVISGIFNLNDVAIGSWDVVVQQNTTDLILSGAFSIEQTEMADPWVHVLGRGLILFNTWSTYTIEYGNNGNVEALGVPLWLVFTDDPGFDIEFIDVDIDVPGVNEEYEITNVEDSIALFFIAENYFGPGKDGRVYPFYIPSIPPNSSQGVHIRIKTSGDLEIESWVSDPYFSGATEDGGLKDALGIDGDVPFSDMNFDAKACIGLSMAKVVTEGLVDMVGVALPIGCINAAVTAFWNPWDYKPKSEENKVPTWGSALWSVSSLVIGCAGDIPMFKAFKISRAVLSLGASMYDAYQADKACREAWLKKSKGKRGIGAVGSFDPNEIVGPDGYGDNNYIKLNNTIPYQIFFENKNDATAPVHYALVSDTLDLTKFDLESFGFGSFGFGDHFISLSGNHLKSFSVDIDLSPDIPIILRVSGNVDAISGIITWEFYSLNPITMLPEEDPEIGFLPPNILSPEGEGFVSYHVGLQQDLTTNTEIKNKALIFFDANEPILTNEYLNVLDIDVPESQVIEISPVAEDFTFTVSWAGSDVGSGLKEYSVWVLVNDTLLMPWIVDTNGTYGEFAGEYGYNYKFYSIARDNVSWIENAPDDYDMGVVVGIEEIENPNANLMVFPNPAKGKINLEIKNTTGQSYEVVMFDLNGKIIYNNTFQADKLGAGIAIDVSMCQPGMYMLKVISDDNSYSKKIIVK